MNLGVFPDISACLIVIPTSTAGFTFLWSFSDINNWGGFSLRNSCFHRETHKTNLRYDLWSTSRFIKGKSFLFFVILRNYFIKNTSAKYKCLYNIVLFVGKTVSSWTGRRSCRGFLTFSQLMNWFSTFDGWNVGIVHHTRLTVRKQKVWKFQITTVASPNSTQRVSNPTTSTVVFSH